MKIRMLLSAAVLTAGMWSSRVRAEEKKAAAPQPTPLVTELDNPSGIAVHGGTGHVFITSRPGVYRYVPDTGKVKFEVKGFQTDIYGKGPKYNIGPLGVACLGDSHLIVSDGSQPDGKELVRVYRIAATAPATPAAANSQEFTLGPIAAGKESAKGEGNFYAIAVGDKALYVTSNGDDTKGWILKADLAQGKPGKLVPFIPTKPLVNVDAPVAITFSPDKRQLVVGQMGEMNVANDSLLCTYDPSTGKLLKSLKTGLHDIAGLAYSPKTGKLYAVDFAWVNTSQGGLFRLDVQGDTVKAEKILSLDKPTALAFDKAGRLYLSQFGTADKSGKFAGTVVRLDAGL